MSDETKNTDNQPSETGTPVKVKAVNQTEPRPVAETEQAQPDFVHGNNPTPK